MTSPSGGASGAGNRSDSAAETVRLPVQDPTHLVRPYVSQVVADPASDPEPTGRPGSGPVPGPAPFTRAVRSTRTARMTPMSLPRAVGGARRSRNDRGGRGARPRPALLVGATALALAVLAGAAAGASVLLNEGRGDSSGQSGPMVDVPLAPADPAPSVGTATGSSAAPDAPGIGGPARTTSASPVVRASPAGSRPASASGAATGATQQLSGPAVGTVPSSGPNEALGAAVTDTGHTQVYTAGNAVDGQPDSYWESTDNAFPQSLTVDLGAVRTVGRLVLELPPLPAWTTRTETFSVLGGTGGSFSTLLASSGHIFVQLSGNTVSLLLPAHPSARYLRLTFTGNTGWPAGQLSELQVYPS